MNIQGANSTNWGTLSKAQQTNDNSENKSIMLQNKSKGSSYTALEKTKEDLLKAKEELMDKKMSSEEKKYKLDEINKKLAEVEAQIQEAKIQERKREEEKLKEKMEKKQSEKAASSDEVRGGVIISESLKNLIESRDAMKNIRDMKVTKANLVRERGWLVTDGNSDSYVTRHHNKLTAGIIGLDNSIASESAKIIRKTSSVNESNVEEKEVDSKSKEDKKEDKKVADKETEIKATK
ncbi:hypothetical protein [Clostridium cylindrosporum]|uniref:Uncharacterized protein n=1 Tax=Clostridium cylindrosporum DSM 605 TaxID=1121307 RepID=A0A0J8DGI6_CLOCY|nr:hypothetical protein [Clostridium cylindrosporum]KMT23339.1 hypothetical protein CLCY_8c00760 [Clostridium cylindrosporum DSM 605]